MADVATLLSEFVDALGAGRQPEAAVYIERAESDDERKELAALIDQALTLAPESATHPRSGSGEFKPLLSRSQLETVAQHALAEPRGWPEVLPGLRAEAELTVEQLARETVAAGGFDASNENVGVAKRWIEQMEQGMLGLRDVSRSALAAIAGVLNTPFDELEWQGMTPLGDLTAFRAEGVPPEVSHKLTRVTAMLDAEIQPEPENPVDRWFAG